MPLQLAEIVLEVMMWDQLDYGDYRGRFWLPGDDDGAISGDLHVEPGHPLDLTLLGELDLEEGREEGEFLEGRMLIGQLARQSIALLKATSTGGRTSGAGVEQRVRSYVALHGVDVPEREPLRFDRAVVWLGGLLEWTDRGHRANFEQGSNGAWRATAPPRIERGASTPFGEAALVTWTRMESSGGQVTLTPEAYWDMKLDQPLTYDELHDVVLRPLQSLLSQLCGTRAPITGMQVWPITEDGDDVTPLSVFDVNFDPEAETDGSWEWPFTLDRMGEERLADVVGRWFDMYRRFKRALVLFEEAVWGETRYALEVKLLLLTQAAEAYHRRNPSMTQFLMSVDDHSSLVEAAKQAVPNEWREWVRVRLHYGREVSQRRRLRELVESTGELGQKISNGHLADLVDAIVNRRNELTHVIPDTETDSDEFTASNVWLYEKLRLLLQGRLLIDLGFDPAMVLEALQRRRWNQMVLERDLSQV